MNPTATDPQIDAARALLDGIEGKIHDGTRAYINDSVDATTAAIDAFLPLEQLEFAAVRTNLAAARNRLDDQLFADASEALNRARSGFATTAARVLSAKLIPTAAPAMGFTPAEWLAFVAEMRQLLDPIAAEPDPERQVQCWNEANRRYLVGVIRQAKSRIDFLVAANIAGAHDRLTEAAAQLAGALNALAAGDLVAARAEYETAIGTAGQVRTQISNAGNTLGAAGGTDAAAPASGAAVPPSIVESAIGSVLPLPLGQGVDIAAVNRTLLVLNAALTLIVLVLAVVSGLQLLYVNNATFGWIDLLIASMWGAGLHAVGGQAFQGLTSLAQQFR
jgi:hypothetical protein